MRRGQGRHTGAGRASSMGPSRCTLLMLMVTALAVGACRSLPPAAPVDLSTPEWRVRLGQAVWKPGPSRPELTGELLLATRENGDFVVRFSKTPFSLAFAQRIGPRWRIEFGTGDYVGEGTGQTPSRFAWFQLPPALAGSELRADWRFVRRGPDAWELKNHRTGERLEGVFFQ